MDYNAETRRLALVDNTRVAYVISEGNLTTSPAWAYRTINYDGARLVYGGDGYWALTARSSRNSPRGIMYQTESAFANGWPTRNLGASTDLITDILAYGDGYWVVGHTDPNKLYVIDGTPADGTISTVTLPLVNGTSAPIYAVAYGNGQWGAVDARGNLYYCDGAPTGQWYRNTNFLEPVTTNAGFNITYLPLPFDVWCVNRYDYSSNHYMLQAGISGVPTSLAMYGHRIAFDTSGAVYISTAGYALEGAYGRPNTFTLPTGPTMTNLTMYIKAK